jgi:starch phosphorylase
LVRQYGGPIQLTGSSDAFYERHLLFDNVADPAAIGLRERYEALARSIRDVLSQRWVRTEQTYERLDPKRVYYLSMEFLIGRSLTNNITNLLLSSYVHEAVKQAQASMDWLGVLEEEPDAGLGNGGLGRLAACFLDSMATLQLPAMGYGLRYEYGMFRQSIDGGWQHEQPDNWLRRKDPWEVARPDDKVEIELNCSFEVRGGTLSAIPGRPATAARRSTRCASGRRTRAIISISRRSATATSSPRSRRRSRPSLSRGSSIPTTPRPRGKGCVSSRSTFSSPARSPI